MILRQFRVTIHEGQEAAFEQVFRDEILPMVKGSEGLVWVAAGKPWADAPNVFCMTMLWRDLEAVKAFAGEDWQAARIEPQEAHLIAGCSLEHYELLGTPGP